MSNTANKQDALRGIVDNAIADSEATLGRELTDTERDTLIDTLLSDDEDEVTSNTNTETKKAPTMNKDETIEWLTLNCDCWKGGKDDLEKMSEERLEALLDDAEEAVANEAIVVNALALTDNCGGKGSGKKGPCPTGKQASDEANAMSEEIKKPRGLLSRMFGPGHGAASKAHRKAAEENEKEGNKEAVEHHRKKEDEEETEGLKKVPWWSKKRGYAKKRLKAKGVTTNLDNLTTNNTFSSDKACEAALSLMASSGSKRSKNAYSASITANSSDDEDSHKEAANLHRVAGRYHDIGGRDTLVNLHEKAFNSHQMRAKKVTTTTTNTTPNTPTTNNEVKKMDMKAWLEAAPPEARTAWNEVVKHQKQQHKVLVERMVTANSYDEVTANAAREIYAELPKDKLEKLVSSLPPVQTNNSTPDEDEELELMRLYRGAGVPSSLANNRKLADENDTLDLPTINWDDSESA